MRPATINVTIQRSFASNRRTRKENNLQRIEKPNGLDQLGSSIRWKKLALFVKILAVKNLSVNSQRGRAATQKDKMIDDKIIFLKD
jgi:hypothetical protein